MAWDWITKGAKKLQDLGDEYKQHAALVERLLTVDSPAAQVEFASAWTAMDERTRAGVKMTLAGLALAQQGSGSSDAARLRTERLKKLQTVVDALDKAAPAATSTSAETIITSSAARVTQEAANFAERAKPRAAELVESAKKGFEQHGPAVEAAVKTVLAEFLKAQVPGTGGASGGGASADAAPSGASGAQTPPPIPDDPPAQGAQRTSTGPRQGTTTISGMWNGTLRHGVDTIGCNLHVAPSGRPLWAYTDTNGFRTEELTHAGQKIQYVPPDRGVVTVIVQAVNGSPAETGYVVEFSFERSSNGYLTQNYQHIELAGRLQGGQLLVNYSERGISSFGDKTGLAAGGTEKHYAGALTKQG